MTIIYAKVLSRIMVVPYRTKIGSLAKKGLFMEPLPHKTVLRMVHLESDMVPTRTL